MRRLALLQILFALGCAADPSTDLYAHPWPDERLRAPDGTLELESFPAGNGTALRASALDALRGSTGFGTAAPWVFPLAVPLREGSLPTVEQSLIADASVFAIDVDRASPHFGERAPVDVAFLPDGGPFGGANLLVVLPYPGRPLRPNTLYAAVVTASVEDAAGHPLERRVQAPTDTHDEALNALAELGVPTDTVARLAVTRTGDPTQGLFDAVAQVQAEAPVELAPPVLEERFASYCLYRSEVAMPVYQRGEPPYEHEGGDWVERDGRLVLQTRLASTVWITVPRTAAASAPSAILVRAGVGESRPIVDRGPRDANGASAPGTGLAREMAAAGYVGVSADGPLGGRRNLTGWDEQTAIFNMRNPLALRDNVRQSALETTLLAQAIEGLRLDTTACPGASDELVLEPGPVLIGHSTGATIAPLAAAVEPRFSALVLSGAGASWIRQVIHKRSPAPLRPVAEHLLDYWPRHTLREHDPLLGLIQWAGEPADPMVYGRHVQDRPVLVFQGFLDTYIPPPISNPLAMSLGLDLAGEPLDADAPWTSARADLRFTGGGVQALPTDPTTTPRLLTQHPPDGIEDGHEVLFQRAEARHQLRCFLASLREGHPQLVAPDPTAERCRFDP